MGRSAHVSSPRSRNFSHFFGQDHFGSPVALSVARMGISLCMIVKNEEDWVEGAVQSVRSIVSEVIIVDTGSTDSTPERIRGIADKSLKLGWNDSFAEARNVSLAEAKEPWILVLDADERIAPRDLPLIVEAIKSNGFHGYHLIQRNYAFGNHILGWTPNESDYEEGKRYPGYVDNPLIRLFRNSPETRFHGTVHEIIDPRRLPPQFQFSNIPAVIHHYGKVRGEERVQAKQRFYLALGLKKIEEEPSNAKAYFELGVQYQELGRHAEACACFDRAFEMTRLPSALLYWAMSEKNLRHYESAAGLLNRALGLGLDTFEVHLELGNVLLAQGEFLKARKEYTKCLEIRPDNPVAAFNYGQALRNMGDLQGAERCYERAFELDSEFREAALGLAVSYLQANKPDEALRVLGKVVNVDDIVLSLIGAAHLQKDNLDEAQKNLEAALKRNRTLIDARRNLAQVYIRKGDHARAARYMQSVSGALTK
jgi:Flp pilus assembly protein TadD